MTKILTPDEVQRLIAEDSEAPVAHSKVRRLADSHEALRAETMVARKSTSDAVSEVEKLKTERDDLRAKLAEVYRDDAQGECNAMVKAYRESQAKLAVCVEALEYARAGEMPGTPQHDRLMAALVAAKGGG